MHLGSRKPQNAMATYPQKTLSPQCSMAALLPIEILLMEGDGFFVHFIEKMLHLKHFVLIRFVFTIGFLSLRVCRVQEFSNIWPKCHFVGKLVLKDMCSLQDHTLVRCASQQSEDSMVQSTETVYTFPASKIEGPRKNQGHELTPPQGARS